MHTVRIEDNGWVYVDGAKLPKHLSSRERAVLRFVMGRKGVSTFETLVTDLYMGRDEAGLKTIPVFVCNLRHKLGEHRRMIASVWGQGYTPHYDYVLIPAIGGAWVDLTAETAALLETTAMESDMTISDLANAVLLEGLKARRAKLWETAA